jgi:hypothetical protein
MIRRLCERCDLLIMYGFLKERPIQYCDFRKVAMTLNRGGYLCFLYRVIYNCQRLKFHYYRSVRFILDFISIIEMARLLFDIFYDEECVSEDAFFEWLKHPDQSETEGKINELNLIIFY